MLSHSRNVMNIVIVLSSTFYIDNKTLILNYNKENDKAKTPLNSHATKPMENNNFTVGKSN